VPRLRSGEEYAQYGECLECQDKAPAQTQRRQPAKRATSRRYEPEHSDAWEANDAEADEFFAYILKLDGGMFYAGQTRELRERLSEHKDGQARSTAGRNPKLVWFGIVSTREGATELEVELKKLVDRNPRAIRRMITDFHDLVRELDFS
jgi:predicted GIY-YIG superfamily endonuclease